MPRRSVIKWPEQVHRINLVGGRANQPLCFRCLFSRSWKVIATCLGIVRRNFEGWPSKRGIFFCIFSILSFEKTKFLNHRAPRFDQFPRNTFHIIHFLPEMYLSFRIIPINPVKINKKRGKSFDLEEQLENPKFHV